jgi:hypothetical protein
MDEPEPKETHRAVWLLIGAAGLAAWFAMLFFMFGEVL